MQSIPNRVQNFMQRRLKKGRGLFYDLQDKRQAGKVKHTLPAVASALLLGLVSKRRTLRDVEALSHDLSGRWRRWVPKPISDTTFDTVSRELSWEQLQQSLVELNREMKRSKLLPPSPGMPLSLVLVDGKNLATLGHDAEGTAQPRTSDNGKWQRKGSEDGANSKYWLTPALRATLASTEARPCMLQMPLPPRGNESGSFKQFLEMLRTEYGRTDVLDVISCDAGMTSLSNATVVHKASLRYIFGLKDNQPELLTEASLLLENLAQTTQPEAQTPWEKRGSVEIKRQLWRTKALNGFENSVGKWSHLQQVWLVRQTTRDKVGKTSWEDRYFLTSIPWDELGAWQILTYVRAHWVIENDVFGSLDMQWLEDTGTWCTQGTAVWALGILRMMAYCIVQCLRRRNCRRKRGRQTWYAPMPWRTLFEHIFDALRGYGVACATE